MSGIPQDMLDAVNGVLDVAERMNERAKPSPRGDSVEAELGFQVETINPDTVRGNFDASRLAQRNPRLVDAIAFMLSLHYLPHDVIAQKCGVSWETVEAVASLRQESIREFKGRLSSKLGLLMDAAMGQLAEKIRRGQVTFLDLKLMHDVWAPLAGEATSIVENRQGLPALDGLMQAMREAVEVRDVGNPSGMGSEAREISAIGGAAPALGDGSGRMGVLPPVRDAEVVELGLNEGARDAECAAPKTQPADAEL